MPYETTGGGTTVLVPNAQVHDLRMEMAGQGLPHGGGVGFEIFDRSTIGMSEFVQKLNYRRALQGELARTIAQMPEVERARVHLAMPERRLFSNEQDRARASVVVSLRSSQMLGKSQVQGIIHLVSSSVEGLQARDVTVVDGHGNSCPMHPPTIPPALPGHKWNISEPSKRTSRPGFNPCWNGSSG